MFKYIILLAVTSSLFAVQATVKKADIVVNINAKEMALKKGASIELPEGSTVCFVSGKGKLAIKALKKQLKKPKRCLMVPISKSQAISYMADVKKKLTISLWDSSESVRHGAGTKGQTEYDTSAPLVVKADQKELLVTGEFGPLDVLVVLLDKEGNEVIAVENSDSDMTIVRIAREQLQTGMTLKISNGFEEVVVSKKIVVEE